jgi:hypothetical protein
MERLFPTGQRIDSERRERPTGPGAIACVVLRDHLTGFLKGPA